MILSLPIGIVIPALIGWLALDLLQGRTRVLWRTEQWTLGYVLGLTAMMFVVFAVHTASVLPLTLEGFLGIAVALLVVLGIPWLIVRKRMAGRLPPEPPAPSPEVHPAVRWSLIALCVWVGLRLAAFIGMLFTMPSFFDDTMDNWNLRGKIFFLDQKMTMVFPWDTTAQGVSSYPPTVPLAKTWFSTLAGGWFESIVNPIHVLWFIAVILLTYTTLRRSLPWTWSLLGAYVLASLPLVFIQGTGTYADIFLSTHIFAAVLCMMNALRAADPAPVRRTIEEMLKEEPSATLAADERGAPARAWMCLAAMAIALVPFTKNEGLVLYFPVLLAVYAGTLFWLTKRGTFGTKRLTKVLLFAVVCIAFFTVPWMTFKLANGLTFGNAKGIDFAFKWHPGVLKSIAVNTFLEGNWIFLFPLFIGLLLLRWKTAFASSLLVLTAVFLIPYLGQLFFYLFTGLAQEALYQTGYARGLIHLIPVVVTLTTFLLHDMIYNGNGQGAAKNGE